MENWSIFNPCIYFWCSLNIIFLLFFYKFNWTILDTIKYFINTTNVKIKAVKILQ